MDEDLRMLLWYFLVQYGNVIQDDYVFNYVGNTEFLAFVSLNITQE